MSVWRDLVTMCTASFHVSSSHLIHPYSIGLMVSNYVLCIFSSSQEIEATLELSRYKSSCLLWFSVCPILLPLFYVHSTATLIFVHHGDSLVIELTPELGSALSECVVDMCVGCVRRSLGFVKLFSHIIGLHYLCAPSILYKRECCTLLKCLNRLPSVFLMSLGLLPWCLLLGSRQQACVPGTLKSSFVAAWIFVACLISLEAERRRITLYWADASWEPLCLQAKCERVTICSSFRGRGPGNPALAEAMHM